jgi:cytochrome c-type biogenesis protein CcmH
MQLLFLALATALVVTVALPLALVLWRGTSTADIERNVVNVAVLRDQLAELERDRINGTLSAADHEHAKQELQRRVLEEGQPDAMTRATPRGSRRASMALAIGLPLCAAVGYMMLGTPAALTPQTAHQPQVTRVQVEAMVASLEEKLKRNPEDVQGWIMLARSYRVFGRHEDAAAAFLKAGAAVDTDPQLLAEYAETLAITRNGDLTGPPTQLLTRALKLSPQHPFALALAGSAAIERKDYAQGIDYWQRLLAQLPPESDDARTLAGGIKKARDALAGTSEPPP